MKFAKNARPVALALAMVAAAGLARAEETVESPLYKQWASFKAGTSVTYKQVTDFAGTKVEGESTHTLVSVTPEEVVVEVKGTSTLPDGKKMDTPPQKMPYPAKIPKTQAADPTAPSETPDQPKPKVTEGSEEIEISGKKYKCKTLANEFTAGDQKMVTKTWMSEEIPGGVAKMESTSPSMTVKQTIASLTIK